MHKRYGWLMALLVVSLLVVACGPEAGAPTLGEEATVATVPTKTSVKATAVNEQEGQPTKIAESPPQSPEDQGSGHILGSPDAPITIVEFSDFQ